MTTSGWDTTEETKSYIIQVRQRTGFHRKVPNDDATDSADDEDSEKSRRIKKPVYASRRRMKNKKPHKLASAYDVCENDAGPKRQNYPKGPEIVPHLKSPLSPRQMSPQRIDADQEPCGSTLKRITQARMPSSHESKVGIESHDNESDTHLHDEQLGDTKTVKAMDIFLNNEQSLEKQNVESISELSSSELASSSKSEILEDFADVMNETNVMEEVDIGSVADQQDVSYYIKPSVIAQQERAWKLQLQDKANVALVSFSSEETSEEQVSLMNIHQVHGHIPETVLQHSSPIAPATNGASSIPKPSAEQIHDLDMIRVLAGSPIPTEKHTVQRNVAAKHDRQTEATNGAISILKPSAEHDLGTIRVLAGSPIPTAKHTLQRNVDAKHDRQTEATNGAISILKPSAEQIHDLGTIRVLAGSPTPTAKHTVQRNVDAKHDRQTEAQLRLAEMQRFLVAEDDYSNLLDLKVTVQGQLFRAHGLLLVAHSHFFRDLYEEGLLKPHCNVEIGNLSADGFALVLRWINSSQLDLTPSTAKEVLKVAQALGIKVLVDQCHEYLEVLFVSPEDCVPLYEYAVRHGLHDVGEEAGRLAAASFPEIFQKKHYLNYTKDQLCLLLSRDDLLIATELDVFTAACDWLSHSLAARREHEYQVLHCVRFKLMSALELRDLLLQLEHPHVNSSVLSGHVVTLLLHALLYHALRAEGYEDRQLGPKPKPRTLPQKHAPTVEHINRDDEGVVVKLAPEVHPAVTHTPRRKLTKRGAATKIQAQYRGYLTRCHLKEMDDAALTIQRNFRGHLVRQQLQELNEAAAKIQSGFRRYLDHKQYDLLTGTAHPLEMAKISSLKFPTVRLTMSSAFMCFGGITSNPGLDPGDVASQIYCFDVTSDKWFTCGTLPEPLAEAAACILGTSIYLTGGYNPSDSVVRPSSAAWKLSLDIGEWHRLPDMALARRWHGLVAIDREIYAVGGCGNSGQPLNAVERYSPDLNKWTMIQPLEVPRFGAGIASHRGTIWVCGGVAEILGSQIRKITDRVDIFQPGKNRWMRYMPLPEPRAFCDIVSINDNLLLIAGGIEGAYGGDGIHVTSTVLGFHMESKEWHHLAILRRGRYKARSLYRDPYLVIIGGEEQISGAALSTVECFDMEDNQWIAIPDLPVSLQGTCCVTLY